MTICFFSAQYLPTVGGVERYTYNLARYAVEAGHRAIVVTSALKGLPETETTQEGIEIYRLPVFPFMNGRFPFLKPCREFSRLSRKLWSNRIDKIVINTRFYSSSVYAAIKSKKLKIPAIVVEHSTGHMPLNNFLVRFVGQAYEHIACLIIKGCCNSFYGVSTAVCDWLRHFNVKAKGTLYNSIDVNALQTLINKKAGVDYRKNFNLPKTTKIVSFIGRMIPEKGIRELICGFLKLNRADVALFVAGDGILLEELRRENHTNIFFLGSIPHEEAISLLCQSDVYCLPTYYAEGFPTTFLEAGLCQSVIVTTRTGGTRELIPNEKYGIVLEDLSESSISTALEKAAFDDEWRKTATSLIKKKVVDEYNWKTTFDRLINILNNIG